MGIFNISLFDHPPQELQLFAGYPPYRIANFLGPPTRRISFTFSVDFLLRKEEKYHPPAESQTFQDYPPTASQKFSDHPHVEFFKGVRHPRPYLI